MLVQVGLDGNPASGQGQTGEKQPWDGVCCMACYFAKYDRCTCKCGGTLHGVGSGKRLNRKVTKNGESQWAFLSSEAAQIYARLVKDWQCNGCEHYLQDEPILHYGHDAGFPVEGFQQKQWLFITCSVCGYQNTLLALGVKPEADYATAQKAPPVKQFIKDKEEE